MVSLSNILTKGANSLLDSTSLGKLLNGTLDITKSRKLKNYSIQYEV